MIDDVQYLNSMADSEAREMITNRIEWATTIDFAVAWASIGSDPEKLISNYARKIRYGIVGLEFNQTDPEFIRKYQRLCNDTSRGIRFFKGKTDDGGIFHPKIYNFYNIDLCEGRTFIGSHNFTYAAFHKNIEASVYIDWNGEIEEIDCINKIIISLKKWWNESVILNPDELKDYEAAYADSQKYLGLVGDPRQGKKIQVLSKDDDGGSDNVKIKPQSANDSKEYPLTLTTLKSFDI